jgi:hypothetical protein
MLSFEFEKELLNAIAEAISVTGIKPHYVLNKIVPIIEKYAAQPGVQRTVEDVRKPCPIHGIKWNGMCGLCVAAANASR